MTRHDDGRKGRLHGPRHESASDAPPGVPPDGYAPANKAAAVRALAGALLFVLADLRRQDPAAAEAERARVTARLTAGEASPKGVPAAPPPRASQVVGRCRDARDV